MCKVLSPIMAAMHPSICYLSQYHTQYMFCCFHGIECYYIHNHILSSIMFTHYKDNIVILMDNIDTDEFSKIIVMIKNNITILQ